MQLDTTKNGQEEFVKYNSDATAEGSVALGEAGDKLYLAFTGDSDGGKNHLFVGQVTIDNDIINVPNVTQLGSETSENGPTLAEYQGRPIIGWTGQDSNLNLMQLIPEDDGSIGFIEPHPVKGGETADGSPALDSNDGSPVIAWTGTDGPGNLYVAQVGTPDGILPGRSGVSDRRNGRRQQYYHQKRRRRDDGSHAGWHRQPITRRARLRRSS